MTYVIKPLVFWPRGHSCTTWFGGLKALRWQRLHACITGSRRLEGRLPCKNGLLLEFVKSISLVASNLTSRINYQWLDSRFQSRPTRRYQWVFQNWIYLQFVAPHFFWKQPSMHQFRGMYRVTPTWDPWHWIVYGYYQWNVYVQCDQNYNISWLLNIVVSICNVILIAIRIWSVSPMSLLITKS